MRPRPACSVGLLLAEARIAGVERIDAMALIGYGLGRTRSWLIAHDDAAVNEVGAALCRDLLNRRVLGEPVAYLVEEKEFHGLSLRVTPDVLIPRPDTETLVDWAIELLDGALADRAAPRVLDLGTGSGAIALAVKHARPRAMVTAVDLSAEALEIARFNAEELGSDVTLKVSDWWSALGNERFDLVLSNPPYIAAGDEHLPALTHEPQRALVAGPVGTEDLARIARDAPRHLSEGGWLLMEHGFNQGEAARVLLKSPTWTDVGTRKDLAGNERCTGARCVQVVE